MNPRHVLLWYPFTPVTWFKQFDKPSSLVHVATPLRATVKEMCESLLS